jgi:hypothetical protein
MSLIEDLAKLKELDPTTYDAYRNGMIKRGSSTADLVWTDVQKAWLQWCLQEAIKARGLHLLQSQDINDGRYYTDISRVGPGYEGDMHVERTLHLVAEEDGDSPVAALLTACIATLEAQR